MQKVQKHVINSLILFLLFTINCNSQNDNVDYLLLNKVIKLTTRLEDYTYNLTKRINADQSDLRKYYDYRYLKEPFYEVLKDYDEEKDSIVYDSKDKQKKRKLRWNLKCKIIDSLFAKEDIERFLEPKEMLSFWNAEKFINFNMNIELVRYRGNYISKPYYRKDNKYAIVLHYFKGTKTLFIFKNITESNWELYSRIDNLWW